MATLAEQVRAQSQQSGAARRPKRTRTKAERSAQRTADALSQTSGRAAGGATAARNLHRSDHGHATHDLEDSRNGRPSRKSTRKSAHHAKPDAQLRRRAMRATASPESRAAANRAAAVRR